jgi:hypothetical protein
VNHAEDGCIGTNAESQREDGDESECGTSPKQAEAKTQVLQKILNVADAARVAAILFGLVEAPEFAAGFAAGFIER